MRVTAVFDMLSTEHVITVPDGLTDGEIRERVEDWLDENLAMVADEMRSSEIWVRSIEKEEE